MLSHHKTPLSGKKSTIVGIFAACAAMLLGFISILPNSAQACMLAAPEPYVVDSEQKEVDTEPPSSIQDVDVSMTRGRGPVCTCDGICGTSGCDDIGFIDFSIEELADDQTSAEKMGIKLEIIDGAAPFTPLSSGYLLGSNGTLTIHFKDDAVDRKKPIEFTFVLYAIDAAGNLSKASAEIRVSNEGRIDNEQYCGCAVIAPSSSSTGALFVLSLVAILALLRRRFRG